MRLLLRCQRASRAPICETFAPKQVRFSIQMSLDATEFVIDLSLSLFRDVCHPG